MTALKQPKPTLTIDFNKLRSNLKELMEEVDRQLASEFDAFSPYMWNRLQLAVDSVILEIHAVRLVLNGHTCAEVAASLGLKKQQVAAYMAYNTMWQEDYASPNTIIYAVECDYCGAGIGERCVSTGSQDARVHDSRRQQYRVAMKARAITTKQIRKVSAEREMSAAS